MHTHLVLVLAAAAMMALLSQVPQGQAVCCGSWWTFYKDLRWRYRCADCSQPKLTYYCGQHGGGGCNLFGCNCGGGCRTPTPGLTCSFFCCDDLYDIDNENNDNLFERQGRDDRRSRRQVTSAAISLPIGNFTGHDVIVAGDLDKNGHLDEVEVHLYLSQHGLIVDDVTAWRQLDSNADGKLTAEEIDHDLHGGRDDVTPV